MFVLSPQVLLRILWARCWLIVGIVAICIVLAGWLTLRLPSSYTASTELVVDSPTRDPLQDTKRRDNTGYIATQLEVIGSGRVRDRVWGYLDEAARARARRLVGEKDNSASAEQARRWVEEKLEADLQVSSRGSSDVARVSLTGGHAAMVAALVNAVAQAYIKASLELRTEPAQRFSQWYEEQLKSLRARVREARQKVVDYREEHGIVGVDEQLDVESDRLKELARMMAAARGEKLADDVRQALDVDGGVGQSGTKVSGNPVVQELRKDLAEAKAQRADVAERYGENHPEYRKADAEVQALRRRLRRESALVEDRLSSAAEMSDKRYAALQEAFREQKQRVQKLNAERSKLELLRQDVRTAEAAYEQAATQASENRLESRLATTDIAVLNRAAVPEESSAKLVLSLIAGAAFGVMLGIAVAVFLEIVNRRVRSREELESELGLPVLAVLPRQRRFGR